MTTRKECKVWATTNAHKKHVDVAFDIMRRAASIGPMLISTSWGKDSIALCDIAIRALAPSRATLLHMASPYGLPGYDEVYNHFEARANVVTLPAARTLEDYFALCEDIGLPHERKRSDQQRTVTQIKRAPSAAYATTNGFTVQALGLRIEEKGPRARVLKTRGPVYQVADGTWRACPLTGWSSRDTWAYILGNNLPYNRRIYDAETHGFTRHTIRNTGWLSTDGAADGRIAWLKRHFPAEYRILAERFPQVVCLES